MKAVKITNPLAVGNIAPLIQSFYDRISKAGHMKGISYETIYTYLTFLVQHAGESGELWVVIDDENKPIAFAVWRLLTTPHYGKVYCDYIYKSIKDHEPTMLLGKEYIKFGENHKALYYAFDAIDEPQAKLFLKLMKELGIDIQRTSMIHLLGRRQESNG